MNKISRILIFVFSIIGMISSLFAFFMIIQIDGISEYIRFIYLKNEGIAYYFAVIVLIFLMISILFFAISILVKSKRNYLLFKKPTGEIKISKSAVNKVILSTINELVNIENVDLKVIYRGVSIKKIKIHVHNRFLEKMPSLLEEIQINVKESVEKTLEIPADKVDVTVTEKQKSDKKDKRVV